MCRPTSSVRDRVLERRVPAGEAHQPLHTGREVVPLVVDDVYGADARPAFPDNLPRVRRQGRITYVNGLFRHGFLLAPALARVAADVVLNPNLDEEDEDADLLERQGA